MTTLLHCPKIFLRMHKPGGPRDQAAKADRDAMIPQAERLEMLKKSGPTPGGTE